MPSPVRWSLCIQTVVLVWDIQAYATLHQVVFITPIIFAFAISVILIPAIACLRNWARFASAILCVSGLAGPLLFNWLVSRSLAATASTPDVNDVKEMAITALDLFALALLFVPRSSKWFVGSVRDAFSGVDNPAVVE